MNPLTPSLSPSDGERVAGGRVRGFLGGSRAQCAFKVRAFSPGAADEVSVKNKSDSGWGEGERFLQSHFRGRRILRADLRSDSSRRRLMQDCLSIRARAVGRIFLTLQP
ncbi:MAG: hypothetical protein DME18_07995 [Verrucomicrobia bacterium]|nr:MAG: hypothetical protein DME18_07995 [Verrucomicrobiota bacterium]